MIIAMPVCLFVAMALLSGPAKPTKATFAKIQAKIAAAFARKDLDTMAKYYAPDYTASDSTGKVRMTRDEQMKDLKRQTANLNHIHWVRTIKAMKVKGNTAVLDVDGHMTADVTMGQRVAKMVFNGRSVETWFWSKARGWQEKNAKIMSAAGTLDGKPFGPGHGGR